VVGPVDEDPTTGDTGRPVTPTPITPTPTVLTTPIVPPTPTPTPTTPRSAAEVAAALLDVATPVRAGSAGSLTLYTATKSTKLGKPKASKLLGAAVCDGGPCRGTATAKLTLTPKAKGKKPSTKTITLVKTLKLSDDQAAKLTLKLSSKDRKAIKAARKATVTLTVTNGTKKVSRTYTLTVG
jgi:hypothetical protein